jgi:tetratricopeptide (TPR) repeat protein
MKKYLGMVAVAICSTVVQGADRPAICSEVSSLPLKFQRPIEDLGGKLPVADYLDDVLTCTHEQVMQDSSIPRSEWITADAKRYTALLAKGKYQWLVLPAQTQYYGFDNIERELIGAAVAEAFADQGAMPDTLLVARALGEGQRRFPAAAIATLVNATHVRKRVDFFAGHDGKNRLTLTLQLLECSENQVPTCRVLKQHDWRALPFSNSRLPFQVVNDLQGEIRREFLAGANALAAAPAPKVVRALESLTPVQVVDAKYVAPPAVTALLASLTPMLPELPRQRLSIISLRAWLGAAKGSEGRFFAAYAAADLQRRPFALALIDGMTDPAAQTLRELLNGNLPEAQRQIANVKAPLQRLMLEFRLQDLAQVYERPIKFDKSLVQPVFGAASGEWLRLVMRRVNDADLWKPSDPATVKVLLDQVAPNPAFSAKSVVVGSDVTHRSIDENRLNLVNLRHVDAALGGLPAAACCAGGTAAAALWPMYWLAEAAAQVDVLRDMNRMIVLQGTPEAALEYIEQRDAILAGEPNFEMLRAYAFGAMVSEVPNAESKRYSQRYEQAEALVARWSQGQTTMANHAVHRGTGTMAFAEAYTRDFPPRPDWLLDVPGDDNPATGQAACLSLEYSVFVVEQVERCAEGTPDAARGPLFAQLGKRFHGHQKVSSIQLVADQYAKANAAGSVSAPRVPDPENAELIGKSRAQFAADPDTWNSRAGMALALEQGGKYEEAQRILLAYPGFRKPMRGNRVELSNNAYEAGSELYWAGQVDLARPLYRIAADLDTGSDASIVSAARLAQLEGDYSAATEYFLEAGSRYSSAYAYRDALSLLFASGRSEQARSGFEQVAEISDVPQAWVAPLVGHRMAGMTYEQMKKWVEGGAVRDARFRGVRFAPYFAMIWVTTDRKPPADFPAFMDQLERNVDNHMDSGFVSIPHPIVEGGRAMVRPSRFRQGKAPSIPDGTPVKSVYRLFADALTATHAGNYAAAVQKFDALADRYSIEDPLGAMYVLPYYSRAAAKSGDRGGLEHFLDSLPHPEMEFDIMLSKATFAAVRKDSEAAHKYLLRAFRVRPHGDSRPMLTEYEYAEVCEFLAAETGSDTFKYMLIDWAHRQQKMQPTHAWGYAVEAQYGTPSLQSDRALAMALYLDPASPRLAGVDAKRRSAAQAWLKANNPFLKQPAATDPRAPAPVT